MSDLITLNVEEFLITIEKLSQHITLLNTIKTQNSFGNSADNTIYLSSNCQKWKSKTVQSVNLQLKPVNAHIFIDKIKISNDWTNQKRTPNFISDFTLLELFTFFSPFKSTPAHSLQTQHKGHFLRTEGQKQKSLSCTGSLWLSGAGAAASVHFLSLHSLPQRLQVQKQNKFELVLPRSSSLLF